MVWESTEDDSSHWPDQEQAPDSWQWIGSATAIVTIWEVSIFIFPSVSPSLLKFVCETLGQAKIRGLDFIQVSHVGGQASVHRSFFVAFPAVSSSKAEQLGLELVFI